MLRAYHAVPAILLAASNALAGTMTFTPLADTTIYNDPALGGTSLDFRLSVNDDFGTLFPFFGYVMNMGITVPGDPHVVFRFNEDLPLWTPDPYIPIFPVPNCGEICLYFGAWSHEVPWPIHDLGTLTVYADGATPSDYEIVVSGAMETLVGVSESIVRSGDATFHVIPEPSSILLLAAELLGVARVTHSRGG